MHCGLDIASSSNLTSPIKQLKLIENTNASRMNGNSRELYFQPRSYLIYIFFINECCRWRPITTFLA